MAHWEDSSWSGPCVCGKGRFVIIWESENYPPFRNRYGIVIKCAACKQTYCVQAISHNCIQLSQLSDHAAHSAACEARTRAWNTDPDVIAAVNGLRQGLTELKSCAARWRWLREYGLYEGCLAYFRRDWRDRQEGTIHEIILLNRRRWAFLDAACARQDAITIPPIPVTRRPFAGTLLDKDG